MLICLQKVNFAKELLLKCKQYSCKTNIDNQNKRDMKLKVKKKWIILMSVMVIIAFCGLFASEPSFVCDFSKINAADVAWLITATIFVLMMTPGLSFFYGGMVGARNVISTMLQSFIAMGIITVLWVAFGFSLCFGDDIGGIIGNPTSFLMFQNVGADTYITPTGKMLGGATIPLALYALFPDEVCHHNSVADNGLVC